MSPIEVIHNIGRHWTVGQSIAVYLNILKYALDIVSGLIDWNELDPVDKIDLSVARVVPGAQPAFDVAAADRCVYVHANETAG